MLLISAQDRLRLKVLGEVSAGSMSLPATALKLGPSYRPMRRVRRRHEQDGDAGLMHRLRGKRSNRMSNETVRAKCPDERTLDREG
jgi:hypothetical protein